MIDFDLHLLTEKYLKNTLSEEEYTALEKLLMNKKNAKIFKTLIQDDCIIKNKNKQFDTEKAFQKIAPMLDKYNSKKVFRLHPIYKYAAAVVVILGLGIFFKMLNSNVNDAVSTNTITDNQIRLILEDGTEQILNSNSIDSVKASNNSVLGIAEKGKLHYLKDKLEAPLAYNTLHIPNGQRFQVILTDGSKVFLNSGSSLRYPTRFSQNNQREVFLSGEAFFDVSKDVSRKFIVNTDRQNIEVLGTEFNVSAYKESETVETTLREGSVKVYNQSDSLLLKPNEQSSLHRTSQKFGKRIVDVSQFTGWIHGKKIFNDKSFNEIIKQLERTYNVTIINKNDSLAEQRFTARFEDESIEQIITYFTKSYKFKFDSNGKTITIE